MSTRSPSKKEKPERGVPVPLGMGMGVHSVQPVQLGQVLTRKSSVILNTRQLRRKEGSIKKISEMTQMLLTPITELTPKVRTRRSPKDKSAEKRDTEKKSDAKEVAQGPQQGARGSVRRRGRKRGAGAGAAAKAAEPEVSPAAAPGTPTAPSVAPAPAPAPALATAGAVLTVRELVALADAQELTDEDLMEILTCDSPVWWEDPPDGPDTHYTEEPIDPEMLHEVRSCSRPAAAAAPVAITIANTNHIDYKFMKKRLKLENVLGNLKGKMNRGSATNTTTKQTESELDIITIEKDADESTAIVKIKNESKETPAAGDEDERVAKRMKKSSESTEGDSIQGFNNEDMLRDLENMDIPVETDTSLTEKQIKIECDLEKGFDDINDNNQYIDLEESETNLGQCDANVAGAIVADTTCSVLSHHEDNKGEIEEKSSMSSVEIVSSSRDNRDSSSIVSSTLSDAVSVTSYTASNTVSDTIHSSSPINGPELTDSDRLNSDVPYSEDDHATDDKIGCDTGLHVLKAQLSHSDRENSDNQDNAEKEIDKKIESEAEPTETCDRNSKDDKVIKESHDESTAEENSSNDDSQKDNSTEDSQKINCIDVNGKETDESATKTDTNIKQANKTKKLNKEQLKAVYKTIVDTGFVQKLNENTKIETSTANPIITTEKNTENIANFYKKCKNIRTHKKTETSNDEMGSIEQNTNQQERIIKEDVSEENHDVKKTNCSCSKGSDIRSMQFSIIPDGRNGGSAKYCMKCSSIFETDTCCYCEKRLLSDLPSIQNPCGACSSYKVL